MRIGLIRLFALAVALVFASGAAAQDASTYPSRPIRLIVCVPPGGGVDTVARIVADGLQKKFGQPVIVENRGGVAGNIGAEVVFNADPDGYTLLAAQPAPLTINPLLYKKLNFDPAQFVPVSIMTTVDNVLLVRKDFPAQTPEEFIEYAKLSPGKINYASQGIGTTSHLTGALFESVTGARLVHVPYKGTSPALNDIIAGHVDIIFMELASAIKLHEAGFARILAVATTHRIPSLPDIKTLDESGVKGFESSTWNAIAAPPKTPDAIVQKLNSAIVEVLQSSEAAEHFKKLNLRASKSTPEEAAAFIKHETELWGSVIKAAGVAAN